MVGISRAPGSLARIFATETTARLLALFALHPERTFLQKELVAATGSSLYLVQRDVKRLETAGLVASTPAGASSRVPRFYGAPRLAGLRDALLRTLAPGDGLRAALADVPGVRLAFVSARWQPARTHQKATLT